MSKCIGQAPALTAASRLVSRTWTRIYCVYVLPLVPLTGCASAFIDFSERSPPCLADLVAPAHDAAMARRTMRVPVSHEKSTEKPRSHPRRSTRSRCMRVVRKLGSICRCTTHDRARAARSTRAARLTVRMCIEVHRVHSPRRVGSILSSPLVPIGTPFSMHCAFIMRRGISL